MPDGSACTTAAFDAGSCVGGVCREVVCGDGVIVGPEVCDDGNQRPADGCSADCLSTETCGNGIRDGAVDEECDDGLVGLSRDGCTSVCTKEFDSWFPRTPRPPDTRANTSMAYDARHHRTVMFGGQQASAYLGDTWLWDGVAWRLADPPTSPSKRAYGRLAYDAAREQVVLFGGLGATGVLADTWVWDGLTWTKLMPATSPPARYAHALAYDAARAEVVLFGGADAAMKSSNDTWTWNGATWTQRSPAASPPTWFGSMAPWNGGLIFEAGNGTTFATFAWDGTTWTNLAPSGQPAAFLTLAPLANGSVAGFSNASTAYLFDGSWTTAPYSPAGGVLGAAYDAGRAITVAYTSVAGSPATYDVTPTTSTAVVNPVQTRNDLSGRTVYSPASGTIVHYTDADQLWEWDGTAWEQRTQGTHPVTAAHVLAATRSGVLLLARTSTDTSETWLWDGTMWTQLAPADSPAGRTDPCIAYDSRRDRVVIFGGFRSALLAETWEWDGQTWTQRASAQAPTARRSCQMVYDPIRDVVVLFGGDDGPTSRRPTGDTWEWDGSSWTQRFPSDSPDARDRHSAAFDAARGRVVIFGGRSVEYLADTWEWDGTNWRMLEPVGSPPRRAAAVAAYDAAHDELVVAGGFDASGTSLVDTWVHRYTSQDVTIDRCTDIDTDGDQLVGCADPDCWGRCTPLCPPRITCDPTLPHCGDGACSVLEDHRLCPADCP
jgi:cysteine-rich repeat protein